MPSPLSGFVYAAESASAQGSGSALEWAAAWRGGDGGRGDKVVNLRTTGGKAEQQGRGKQGGKDSLHINTSQLSVVCLCIILQSGVVVKPVKGW